MSHTSYALARSYWFGRRNVLLAPEDGATGGGGASPSNTPVSAADAAPETMQTHVQTDAEPELMALVPDAKLLSGLAEAPAEEGTASPAPSTETETEEAPDVEIAEEPEAAPNEEPAKTEEPPDLVAVKKENAELKRQLEEKTALGSAQVIAPTDPLSGVKTPQQLVQIQKTATELKEWAFDHMNEGGEMPAEIVAAMSGEDPAKAQPRMMTPEDARALYKRSDAMLTKLVPARAQFLQVEAATVEGAKKIAPEVFQAGTPSNKAANELLQMVPQLTQHPQWAAIVADWAAGYQARLAKEAITKGASPASGKKPAAVVKTAAGKTVPLAPTSSTGGARTTASPAIASTAKTRQAADRLSNGKASQADYLELLKVAN